MSILMGVLMSLSLVAVSSGTANAAEAIPTLKWSPPASVGADANDIATSPTGSASLPCTTTNGGSNLVTYSATGTLSQNVSRTSTIDGVTNCIITPIADKNGDVYGVPFGQTSGGGWSYGPNLLAYSGNTLKWKYAATCTNGGSTAYVVGADGNIYTTNRLSSGDVRLIGLTPNVAAGQTQPTKVLDIDIPDDCSIKLRAYKDGLILHGQSSGDARYYSYAGKFLGQATIGDVWYEKTNADGMLFKTGYTSGSYTSGNVSMYDPRTGSVKWTTTASTSGANVNGIQVYPVSGGGVVTLVTEQKMVSGIPASPTEYITTLVVLNGAGTVTKSLPLSNTYSQSGVTGKFTSTYAVADTQGKIVVVRNMDINTGISWPTTVPAIALSVYDIANDTWSYQQVMRGDLTKAGGPSGYRLDFASLERPVGLTNGTIYLTAKCTNNCADYGQKLYAVQVTGLGMDYPRGTVFAANTPAQSAPLAYVAMGDSYSSGQGAGTYDDGTVTSTNKCYKSLSAYGRVSDRNPNSALSLTKFAACGGSVTSDIKTTGTYSGVSPQDTALSSTTTKVVSISIGGNDIGFADVIKTCADPTKDCDGAFNAATNLLGTIFDNKLQTVYLDILQKAPLAQIYVLGYPPLLTSATSGCLVGNNGSSTPFYGADRAQKAVTLSNSLNTSIKNNVNTVRALGTSYQRLHFVDAMATGSPFIGHDVCSSDPYVNGLILPPGDSSESFHPNVKGQKAYADLLAAAMTP